MIIIDNEIKWSDCYLFIGSYSVNNLESDFEIKPVEFLNYAKYSISMSPNKRDCINSVINAKLAIDSQIDAIIGRLGYMFNKFPLKEIDAFLSKCFVNYYGENKKLSFVSEMGISPKFLISKYRNIRNLLEHEYKLPTIEQAIEFVEIAELFINSTTHKLGLDFTSLFYINNSEKQEKWDMCFDFDNIKDGTITINSHVNENVTKKIFAITDKEYLLLLSCVIKKEFYKIPRILGHDIDERYVKITIAEYY